jgi:hypothetical protein
MVYQWDINAFQIKEKLFIKNIKQTRKMFVKNTIWRFDYFQKRKQTLFVYLSTNHCQSLALGWINFSLKSTSWKRSFRMMSSVDKHMKTITWYTNSLLTGIMLLPGSFSGRISSPRPHRGPLWLCWKYLVHAPRMLEKIIYKNRRLG